MWNFLKRVTQTQWIILAVILGIALYFVYGFRHSTLRRGAPPEPVEPPMPIEKT